MLAQNEVERFVQSRQLVLAQSAGDAVELEALAALQVFIFSGAQVCDGPKSQGEGGEDVAQEEVVLEGALPLLRECWLLCAGLLGRAPGFHLTCCRYNKDMGVLPVRTMTLATLPWIVRSSLRRGPKDGQCCL